MSNYTQITFFAPKDALLSGDPNKIIHGTQVDPELAAIATAITSKFDILNMGSIAQLAIGSGTVGAPSYSFNADTTTGWYLSAVGILAAATGGIQRGTIGSSGNWTINAPSSGIALTLANGVAGQAVLSAGPTASSSWANFPLWMTIGHSAGDYPRIGYNTLPTTTPGTYNYASADLASAIYFTAGGFQFLTAPSGTAGNPITFTTAMQILQAGNVTINAPSSGVALSIAGLAGANDIVDITSTSAASTFTIVGWGNPLSASSWNIATRSTDPLVIGTVGAAALSLYTAGASRIAINSSGNVSIAAPGSGTTLALSVINSVIDFSISDGTGVTAHSTDASHNQYFGAQSNHGFNLLSNNLTRIAIANNGTVTINAPTSGGPTFQSTSIANQFAGTFIAPNTAGSSFGVNIQAGTNSTDQALQIVSAVSTVLLKVWGDGGVTVGAAPTGGDKGAGTINATNLYVNGTAVLTSAASGANPTALVGLAAVNGSAGTFLRSDGAPALDVTISPTWTGNHIFNPTAGTPLLVKLSGTSLFSVNGTSSPTIQGYGPVAAALVDMTPDSGTYTGTMTGGTTAPTSTITWRRTGNLVTMNIGALAAVSNAVSMTITGSMPSSIQPTALDQWCPIFVEDNGSFVGGYAKITHASSTITILRADGANFSAVGTKGVAQSTSFSYMIA